LPRFASAWHGSPLARCIAPQVGAAHESGCDDNPPQEEANDLPLNVLYEWHKILKVPMAELLVESEYALSQPLKQRAQLVRLMKTALTLLGQADNKATRLMAQTLVDQLLEVMPELQGISAWNAVGARRRLDELGVAALRTLSEDAFLDCFKGGPPFRLFTKRGSQLERPAPSTLICGGERGFGQRLFARLHGQLLLLRSVGYS